MTTTARELDPTASDEASVSRAVRPAAESVRLWDNANIVESFPDLTLPLTFSVAVELYASVYRRMCLALGVPRGVLGREADVFEQMLGLLQGRVYYNLTSWYRVLALLPGFRLTAGFLEAMMGTERPGAKASDQSIPVTARAARWWELAGMTVRLAYRLLRLRGDVARFRATIAELVDAQRGGPGPAASPESPEQLLADFDTFCANALGAWRAPIMNDLFLMLAHGALRCVADRWLGAEARSLVNAALVQGKLASTLPGRELVQIAAAIRGRNEWAGPITSTPPGELPGLLNHEPELADIAALIAGYLDRWGDRAPRELQLERPTYRDDPAPLLRAIQALVGAPPTVERGSARHARARISGLLLVHPLGPIRLAVVLSLLSATRRHIRWREEMRLDRGRVFGVGRRIFRRLGELLAEQGTLERADDVHYLSVHELRGLIRGTTVIGEPRALVRMRRDLYDDYAARHHLPSRFETTGPITDPLAIHRPAGPTAPATPTRVRAWSGIGATQGRVTGPCLVVRDPATVTPAPGHVIAAHTTDPGWVPLLVGAAGLLVEQGGILSHSAIMARELGIPTVLGLAGLLDSVRTGDVVELDGATGEVTLLVTPGDPA